VKLALIAAKQPKIRAAPSLGTNLTLVFYLRP